MGMDAHWTIFDSNQLQLCFLTCPVQMVKPLMHLACTHVRTQFCASARTDMADIRRFDPWVMGRITKAMPRELHARLFLTHALGSISEEKLSLFNPLANPACPHCGHPHGTPLHKFWHCPAHAAVRFEGAEHLKALFLDNVPHHMLLGIPGTYDAMPNAHYATPIASEGVNLRFLGSVGITFKGIPSSQALSFAEKHEACLSQLDNIQFASAYLEDARPSVKPTILPIHGAPPM